MPEDTEINLLGDLAPYVLLKVFDYFQWLKEQHKDREVPSHFSMITEKDGKLRVVSALGVPLRAPTSDPNKGITAKVIKCLQQGVFDGDIHDCSSAFEKEQREVAKEAGLNSIIVYPLKLKEDGGEKIVGAVDVFFRRDYGFLKPGVTKPAKHRIYNEKTKEVRFWAEKMEEIASYVTWALRNIGNEQSDIERRLNTKGSQNNADALRREALQKMPLWNRLPLPAYRTDELDFKNLAEPSSDALVTLFADMRNFGKFVEQFRNDQSKVKTFLDEFFNGAWKIVFNHYGEFDKAMGDGFMALFGTRTVWQGEPILKCMAKDSLVRAVCCAQDVVTLHGTVKQSFSEKQKGQLNSSQKSALDKLDMGIGIGVGYAMLGRFGPMQQPAFTALGLNVNKTKRVEVAAAAAKGTPNVLIHFEQKYEAIANSPPCYLELERQSDSVPAKEGNIVVYGAKVKEHCDLRTQCSGCNFDHKSTTPPEADKHPVLGSP